MNLGADSGRMKETLMRVSPLMSISLFDRLKLRA